jgi:hypothetical protein
MSNRFFNFTTGRLIPNTVAKSTDVNSIFDSVVVGIHSRAERAEPRAQAAERRQRDGA